MATKRKNQDGEGSDTPRSHGRKKVKIQIATQAVSVADGACPALRIRILPNTPKGRSKLPVSLDVERFADVNLVHPLDLHSPI